MAVALILVLVALGSVAFHLLSPWWWTPIASNWQYIDNTILITFWITGAVFVAVVLFMAYCVFRFRHKPGQRALYEPENKRLEIWLTVVTGLGVAAMLAPGLFVWQQFVTVPEEATDFEVVGQQWRWSFRLPGQDGKLGRSDTRHISADNPLGLDPDDPHGQDDIVIDGGDLHLPVGKPVKVAAALDRRPARFLRAGVPRQDGHGAGHRHLFLADPDADRHLRGPVRRIVRHRPSANARNVVVEDEPRPLPDLAGGHASAPSRRCAPRKAAPRAKARSLAAAEPNKTGAERTRP